MVVTADGASMPNSGGLCRYSDYLGLGDGCKTEKPCTECQYWPIYPCYTPKPVVYCSFVNQGDSIGFPTQKPMYDRAAVEGFDSRYFEFPDGAHQDPKNKEEWYAG